MLGSSGKSGFFKNLGWPLNCIGTENLSGRMPANFKNCGVNHGQKEILFPSVTPAIFLVTTVFRVGTQRDCSRDMFLKYNSTMTKGVCETVL